VAILVLGDAEVDFEKKFQNFPGIYCIHYREIGNYHP